MKLVQYSTTTGGPTAPGVQLEDGSVLPLSTLLDDAAPTNLRQLFAAGPSVLDRLRGALETHSAQPVPAGDVRLSTPLGTDILVVCAGANFHDHLAEMEDAVPEKPAWFIKNSNSISGPGDVIRLPKSAPDRVDWEGELGVVIGAPCFAVSADDAMDYVAGYTLLNDVSARDAVSSVQSAQTALEGRWAWTDMLLGKQFPTFGPLGPVIVTSDEMPDINTVRLTTTVNGKLMQDALIADLAVGIPGLIEEFSRYFQFEPGDVISTGTPAGVGVGRNPPVFLNDGDVVTVAASGIGELTNTVVNS